MRRQAKKFAKGSPSDGSALILTVVLTSLLAMVGVLFVMMARVNQIATSGISESRELDSAIETAIAKISEELVLDVPGVAVTEYYDYPGSNDEWLASLEPYQSETDPNKYYWRQISDVTGYFSDPCDVKDVPVVIIGEYDEITKLADADGDGVADSKWIELDDITSSKGKPIYAAIRIVDNGGMINVNTAYKFDPNDPTVTAADIDGSSLMQINLMALSWRPNDLTSPYDTGDENALLLARNPSGLAGYEDDVIWQYGEPCGPYTPFDISDELEMRNRFVLNHQYIYTRLENWSAQLHARNKWVNWTPFEDLSEWFRTSCIDANTLPPDRDYSYRHIATAYNMDRIINPSGNKMLNINTVSVADYNTIKEAFTDSNFADVNGIAAQITVNLIDFRDEDVNDNVTTITVDGTTYYGFERPCVYISELAHKFLVTEAGGGPVESDTWRSYAVELYKPYTEDAEPNDWRLFIDNSAASPPSDKIEPVDWSSGSQRFHVIRWENTYTELDVDPNASSQDINNLYNKVFDKDSIISLQRRVDDVNNIWISVDSHVVPGLGSSGWLVANDGTAVSIQRDITLHKCIRRLWAGAAGASTPTLGATNNYWSDEPNMIQAHPYLDPLIYGNQGFKNIGEIGMVFRKPAYYKSGQDPLSLGVIGYSIDADTEDEVRINLAEPEFQQIFKYLTVFDPAVYSWNDSNETRIKGRININTAPWFVIAQLPWIQYTAVGDDYQRAQRIADNRGIKGPYKNIGELMRVAEMKSLYLDDVANLNTDDPKGPDLTYDGALDDFEERDLIFSRISNLVTVRSDVFTAYILVRIGPDGPQKRVVAILDRSDVYPGAGGVRIVALHPVADPR